MLSPAVQLAPLPIPAAARLRWGRHGRAGRVRGFTLIELLVVFGILALLAGMVPFAFGRLHESAQYRDTVRAVLTDMRHARQLAQSRGADARFVVNLSSKTFGVEGEVQTSVPDSLVMRAVMAEQESGDQGQMAIRFLPRGGATGGSVDLIRSSGSGVRLRVDWFSGQVEQEPIQP